MRYYFYVLISLIICIKVYGAETPLKDEIVFFNVGQGHAALVYKAGHVPLLIDAGSDGYPNMAGEMYEWTRGEEGSLLSLISDKILDYWKNFNRGNLQGVQCNLNIIITHSDTNLRSIG